MEIFKL